MPANIPLDPTSQAYQRFVAALADLCGQHGLSCSVSVRFERVGDTTEIGRIDSRGRIQPGCYAVVRGDTPPWLDATPATKAGDAAPIEPHPVTGWAAAVTHLTAHAPAAATTPATRVRIGDILHDVRLRLPNDWLITSPVGSPNVYGLYSERSRLSRTLLNETLLYHPPAGHGRARRFKSFDTAIRTMIEHSLTMDASAHERATIARFLDTFTPAMLASVEEPSHHA